MKIILVEWVDAVSVDAWTSIEEAKEHEPVAIVSCGFLLEDKKNSITIALSIDNENECTSQYLAIPKAWLKSVKVLRDDNLICVPKTSV